MSEGSQSRQMQRAREHEARVGSFIPADERPVLHLSPQAGWMNDPNGFSFYNGKYHLFYQYNPYSTRWSTMHWGHAVSDDLLRWEYLPVALAPDEEYESKGGCFSGSAVALPDGRHMLMYTSVGAGERKEDGLLEDLQQQCVAFGDGVEYAKYEGNPVIGADMLPEGTSPEHFRDPKVWIDENGVFRCIAAHFGADRSAHILRFASDDGLNWRADGELASNRGRYGRMWECPDFFELDGKNVLIVSPQDMLPVGHDFHSGNNVICIVGHVDELTGELVEETVRTVDHGIDFYAAQTMLTPDGRRVMIGWMQNWDTVLASGVQERWFGQMSIPRELSLRDGKLIQHPVRELEALRSGRVEHTGVEFEGEKILEGVSGRCVDLTVSIRSANPDDPYSEFGLWIARDEHVHTSLRYRPAKGEIKVNRTRSGSRRAILHHRKCIVQGERDALTVRVIADRHSAEYFINDGELVMSVTIPTDQAADGISFFAKGNVVMDVIKYNLDAK